MKKQAISTHDAPQAVGPYSQAMASGGFLFCSGQVPLDPSSSSLVEGDITAQTHRIMQNLQAVLKAAQLKFDDVVQSKIYLTNMADFKMVNEVYASYLSEPYPARACIEVSGLPLGAKVEIEMIARQEN